MKPLCSHCQDRPVHDNAYLCAPCSATLDARLLDCASYAGELVTSYARLTTGGASLGRPSADSPLPYNGKAGEAAADLHSTLSTWVRLALAEHTPGASWGRCRHVGPHRESGCDRCPLEPHDDTASLARWLHARADWLRHHPAAGDLLAQVDRVVTRARSIVHGPGAVLFAGPCGNPECPDRLYARPGSAVVACRSCGTEHDVAACREWMLAHARDQLAHASLIGRALPNLGVDVTGEAIRKWAERGRLAAHGHDEHGRPLYRVGDVERLALDAAERKRERMGA